MTSNSGGYTHGKARSCAFNIDTACVELHFTDGSIYSINCTAVENEAADNGACCLTASQLR
ncbi:MAG: DUF6061 family protein [Christensenellales bacterium]